MKKKKKDYQVVIHPHVELEFLVKITQTFFSSSAHFQDWETT